MKLQSLNQVHIPVPCHENWDAMTEAEKGRFCAVCQKTVVDFSQMNELQILDFLSQKKQSEEICGRFKTSQLPKTSHSWADKISQKLRCFALALLMAFGIPKISKAQLHEKPDKTEHLQGGVSVNHATSVSGTVKNKETQIVLSNATVQLWKDNQLVYTTKTNENGFYEFKTIEEGTYTLKISKQNYVPYIINEVRTAENKRIVADAELYKTPKSTKPDKETPHKVGKICIDKDK
jgi:hypothetical protein